MKELFVIIRNSLWVFSPFKAKQKLLLLFAFILILGSSLLLTLVPSYIGKLIDNINNHEFVKVCLITIGALYLADLVLEIIRKYIVESAATKLLKEFTVKVTSHLLYLDIDWLNKQRSGGLNGRIQRSVEGAVKLLKLNLMDFAPSISQMVFAIIVAFAQNTIIGLLIMGIVPVGFVLVFLQINSQKGIRISLLRAFEENESNIIEILSGIETVRISAEECNQMKRFSNTCENLRQKEMKHHIAMMFFDSLKKINNSFWHIIILLVGFLLYTKGSITVGEIVLFNLLFQNVLTPLQNIHRFIDEGHESSIKIDDLKDLLNVPMDISYSISVDEELPMKSGTAIKINSFNSYYDSRNILKDLNLELLKGSYYGLIGTTGCGKSTLIKSMLNLLHNSSGSIQIYGSPLNQISRETLANLFLYMPQNPFIFHGTIKENILFGCKREMTEEELINAAKSALIYDDILQMDNKMDSLITERGSNLSGGQRQRLALARIFLRFESSNNSIIILDEATSALDNETEKKVLNNLLELLNNGTTIISIAHRLSTLEKADKIFKMDNGKIIKETAYSEL